SPGNPFGRPAFARSPDWERAPRVVGSSRRRFRRAAHRLHERREFAFGPRHRPPAGIRGACRSRRRSLAIDSPDAHRKLAARFPRRLRRTAARLRPAARVHRHFARGNSPFARSDLDVRVLVFTFAAAIASAIFFGLASAPPGPAMSSLHGGRAAGSRSRGVLRLLLASTQIAVSIVLLVGAGLLLRSLWNLER